MNESSPPSSGRQLITDWLNRPLCVHLTDGRKVVGTFLCTDNECNIILGQTREYWPSMEEKSDEEPRVLGLTMVPGKHIVSIAVHNSISNRSNVGFEFGDLRI